MECRVGDVIGVELTSLLGEIIVIVVLGTSIRGFDTGVELNRFSFKLSATPFLRPGPESDAERIPEFARFSSNLLVGSVYLRGESAF